MIRHIRWQILLVISGLILAGVLLSFQAVGLEEISVPATGGTMVEAVAGWPENLNPLLSFTNPVDRDVSALVFEGLTRYDEHGQLAPALASGWEVSLDGLVYTFWLRQDVMWQDGILFSADDVVYTTQLLQDPGYTGPSDLSALWQEVQVEEIDRWTVTFTLPEPFSPFLDYTSIGILPAHLLDGVTAEELPDHPFNRNPVGTGRFQVTGDDWASGRLLLIPNPSHWSRERPKLAGIEFRFFPDYSSALAAFETGDVHGVSGVQQADIARAQALEEMNLFTSSLPRYSTVLLNLQDDGLPFFQERGTRQALLYGLDRPGLIGEILNGQGIVAHSPIHPGSWAHYGDVIQHEYDPNRAAEYLEAAGWILPVAKAEELGLVESEELVAGVRARDGLELSFTLTATEGTPHERLANGLARQWAKLGVRATVDLVEPGQVSWLLENGEFDAALVDVDMRGDPDLYPFWSESAVVEGQNYGGWRNREASQLLEQARQLTNREQRTTLYYHFQQIFSEEVPALLLFYHTYSYGISDKVQHASMGPLTDPSDRFATIDDWFLIWREVIMRRSRP